jgi:hypothetical protein
MAWSRQSLGRVRQATRTLGLSYISHLRNTNSIGLLFCWWSKWGNALCQTFLSRGFRGNTSEFSRKENDLLGMGIMLSDSGNCHSCMHGGVTSLQLSQTEVQHLRTSCQVCRTMGCKEFYCRPWKYANRPFRIR